MGKNRHERRSQEAQARREQRRQTGIAAATPVVPELVCDCGWPIPSVWLSYEDKKPSQQEWAAMVRGLSVLIDCPQCGKQHAEPMGLDDDAPNERRAA